MIDRKAMTDVNAVLAGCDNIVNEIKSYFTTPDTMGAYWAFLNQFWAPIVRSNGEQCALTYQPFFAQYGLAVPVVAEADVADADAGEPPPPQKNAERDLLALQGIVSDAP
jgi:hypothetical protein